MHFEVSHNYWEFSVLKFDDLQKNASISEQ